MPNMREVETVEPTWGKEWYSLPREGLEELIADYCNALDTGKTQDWCACPWLVHPEDIALPFEQQRKRREDTHPLCPTHTREGLIKGFILWAVKNGN